MKTERERKTWSATQGFFKYIYTQGIFSNNFSTTELLNKATNQGASGSLRSKPDTGFTLYCLLQNVDIELKYEE